MSASNWRASRKQSCKASANGIGFTIDAGSVWLLRKKRAATVLETLRGPSTRRGLRMTDRPILFSAPMVQALLAGRKTQTRRVLPHPEHYGCPTGDCPHDRQEQCNQAMVENTAVDLRFRVGDRLWVKETWRAQKVHDDLKPSLIPPGSRVWHEADGRDNCDQHGKTRVSIFMPRWASRLTLIVTDVRVELVQDCSEADAMAEGIEQYGRFYGLPDTDWDNAELTAVAAYHRLWNSINGPGAWEANPWVVAVSFEVRRGNIDTPAPSPRPALTHEGMTSL